MTQHDDQIGLRQMLDAAEETVQLTTGYSFDSFIADRVLCLAIERLMLNIGEASNRISKPTQEKLSNIPWPEIAAFRNRIVHGYDSVDYNRIWQVLKIDLPVLITELKSLNLPEKG